MGLNPTIWLKTTQSSENSRLEESIISRTNGQILSLWFSAPQLTSCFIHQLTSPVQSWQVVWIRYDEKQRYVCIVTVIVWDKSSSDNPAGFFHKFIIGIWILFFPLYTKLCPQQHAQDKSLLWTTYTTFLFLTAGKCHPLSETFRKITLLI